MVDPQSAETQRVRALRELLPATGAGIYLDTANRGPLPAETAAAMREAEDWELRVGRATEGRDEDYGQRSAEARAVLAALIGDDPSEVALTTGVQQALAICAWAPDWRPGDRAFTIASAGPEILAALHPVTARSGVELDLGDIASRALDERTRLVMVPRVDPATGALLPLDKIAAEVRRLGAWLAVDASLTAGALALDVGSLGADFVAFAGDRWLLGPEGTGALWVGHRALAEGRASFAGPLAYETLQGSVARPWPDARRFEPGGLSRTAILGLARSVGWLEMYVGLEWAFERGQRLAVRLHSALVDLTGVEVLTPADRIATIVVFRLPAWTVEEAQAELRRRVFAIVGATPDTDATRASVGWFNTEDELDRFAEAVAELGRHTRETLPQRSPLIVT